MIYAARFALIVVYTVFWGTVGVVLGLLDRSGRGVEWVARSWVRWVFASCGIRVECEGLENVARDRPLVFMANHQSVIDIGALILTLPVSWRFVAKRELVWIPFFGWALALQRHVLVDRSDHAASIRSLRRAAEQVRGGTNVVIFPEGTRSPAGKLRSFKSGGFHLVLQAQVPIVPVTVSGSQRITPKHSLRVESGRVKIRYGVPIPTEGLGIEDRQELKDRVRSAIQRGFDAELQGPGEPAPASVRDDPKLPAG